VLQPKKQQNIIFVLDRLSQVKAHVMQNVIVAGILNTLSGEISDTITEPRHKKKLYRKTEKLNTNHCDNTFMVFEFGLTGASNIPGIKEKMLSNNQSILNRVLILKSRYDLFNKKNELNSLKSELEHLKEALRVCFLIYETNQYSKREVVSNALQKEISAIEELIFDAEKDFNSIKRELNRLESKFKKNENGRLCEFSGDALIWRNA